MMKMKAILPLLCLCLLLSACDQFVPKKDTVSYRELTAKKNYYDSIPHVRIRDMFRPYRYYLGDKLYTGRVADYYTPGHPKMLGAMKDGYASGEWRYYFNNDSLQQIGSFRDGYQSGEWIIYGDKRKINTRLIYAVDGRQVTSDTLVATYPDGSSKEWKDGLVTSRYPNGKTESIVSLNGETGFYLDREGNRIAELNNYVKVNKKTGEKIYYLNYGINRAAYRELEKSSKWDKEDLENFEKASTVTQYQEHERRGNETTIRYHTKVAH